MVRFIIDLSQEHVFTAEAFTFQYGQIYYIKGIKLMKHFKVIYIPIWLDLLFNNIEQLLYSEVEFTFQYGQIYYSL